MNIATVREQFPQYDDLSDAELTSALHRKFYSDMPLAEFSQKIGLVPAKPAKEPEGPSLTDQVMEQLKSLAGQVPRQAGLTGRYLVEGATALPAVIGNVVNTGINKLTGSNLGMPSQAISQGLTALGLPEPQPGMEEVIGTFARALPSVGGAAALAQASPKLAWLGKDMLTQGQAALGGAAAAEGAKGAGAGEGGQLAAGLAGGILAPTAAGLTTTAARAGREAIRPLTATGQEQIVGTGMNRMARDPKAAQAALQNPETFVAGSVPTTAQASGDLGLLAAERAVQRTNPALFAEQQQANNAARLTELKSVAGPDNALDLAIVARDAKALPILDRAFNNAKPVNTAPVEKVIYTIGNASKDPDLRKALGTIQNEIAGETNPHSVYEVRKLVDQMLDVSIPKHASLAKYSRTSLLAVKSEIDNVLNKATKNEFGKYLDTYRDMSKYVDRAQAGQKILGKFDATALDAAGNPIISAHALKTAVGRVKNPVTGGGAETIFNTGEMDALTRVIADLDRAGLSNNAVRSAGSDTFQNLATGNMISQTLGGAAANNTLLRTIGRRPLDFLYKPAEAKMQGLLAEGFLNPQRGRELMQHRLPQVEDVNWRKLLEKYVARGAYGGLLGDLSER
jgi:hypothetical protein